MSLGAVSGRTIAVVIVVVLAVAGGAYLLINQPPAPGDIGNEPDKADLIRLTTPRPNQAITSPLTITGEARGTWYFEASFPVVLTDWDGRIIAQGIATAQGEWMTAEFVPFVAILAFTVDKSAYSNKGTLILRKDNPSGLPEHDDALEVPVILAGVVGGTTPPPPPVACTQEAKLCPDGSYVGRTGPTCAFAACPQDPIGRECAGANDTSCPTGYACVQGCGLPVARVGDPPAPYYCQLKGYERTCPICLAGGTLIDTPLGAVAVEDLRVGATVWTVGSSGARIASFVRETSKTPVPPSHTMVSLVLDDGRALLVSPGHPTKGGRTVGELAAGDTYDGARVASADRVAYGQSYTYDLLPSGPTGFYFANGILLDSTLH